VLLLLLLLLFVGQVSPAAEAFSGNATGRITFTITSPALLGADDKAPQASKVAVPLSAVIKPTPPREQRIVWDVLHSIKYPPGYVPRDNLDIKVRRAPQLMCGSCVVL
jgi:membrane-bound transcription factor site-1 protease